MGTMAGNVPIGVEKYGNPPFMETDIEKLPIDEDNPNMHKLRHCKLIPGCADNEILIEQQKKREEFEAKIKAMGFGNALQGKKQKQKTKTKLKTNVPIVLSG